MLSSTVVEKSLKVCFGEPIEERLNLVRKSIASAERGEVKPTCRFATTCRHVLSSITTDGLATASQCQQVAELYDRVGKLDPRIARRNRRTQPQAPDVSELDIEEIEEEGQTGPLVPFLPDGFEPDFIDPRSALSRVSEKYGANRPEWSDTGHAVLLQVALGDSIPIDEHAVQQLWLALAYYFKERLEAAKGSMSPHYRWLLSSACAYANRHGMTLPAPNCLTITEELLFRD